MKENEIFFHCWPPATFSKAENEKWILDEWPQAKAWKLTLKVFCNNFCADLNKRWKLKIAFWRMGSKINHEKLSLFFIARRHHRHVGAIIKARHTRLTFSVYFDHQTVNNYLGQQSSLTEDGLPDSDWTLMHCLKKDLMMIHFSMKKVKIC